MMGHPAIPFRLSDFWAIYAEEFGSGELEVVGALPGGGLCRAVFPAQPGPRGDWIASSLVRREFE